MLQVLAITGPIYLMIGAGWLAVRRGFFAPADARAFARLALNVLMPAVIFRALAQRPVAEILDLRYVAAYTAGSLAVFLGGLAWARHVRGRPPAHAALHGFGLACANSGFVGYPIVQQVLGPAAGVPFALTLIVENLVIIPLALALLTPGADVPGRGRWKATAHALAGVARHPLILAIAAGVLVSLAGWTLPVVIDRTLDIVAAAAPPVALFAIGGALVGLTLRGERLELLGVALGKLVLHPAAVAFALWLLGPVDPALWTAGLLFAAMPMMTIYPILAQPHGREAYCAAAMLVATVLSFVTISALVAALGAGSP